MIHRRGLASFLAVFVALAAAVWSWATGAPRPLPAFEPLPGGVLSLSSGDAGGPAFSSGVNDTFYFGGTRWAPDSSRWEAIPDSVWTFESGVGSHYQHPPGSCKDPNFHELMEGWVGADPGSESVARFRRLGTSAFSGTPCVGAAGGLAGSCSFWAGLLEAEADSLCWAAGQGYGNNWSICIVKEIAYDGAGCLHLDFRYQVDVEPGWDYVFVRVDTTGVLPDTGGVRVTSYTGPATGTENLTLTAGANLPSQAGPVRVKFCVLSDGAYSDEDGLYSTTCGAFGVDDVHVWNTNCGGTIDDLSTFEAGSDGWVTEAPCLNGGDLSRLVPVGELPWPPGYIGGCDLGDSVLAFYDSSTGGHPLSQIENFAVSPWIDLKAAGKVGFPKRFLELGGYYELPLRNYIFVAAYAQWYPAICSITGRVQMSAISSDGYPRYFAGVPTCAGAAPRRLDFTSFVPPTAEQVRVGVGLVNYARYYHDWTGVNNSTPWFDDVRFGVTTTNTIQSLVDAAAPGDTVIVGAGTYTGSGFRNITFRGKEIVLLATAGPEHTIIDCQGAARGFVIDSGEDSTLVIDGFTVRNGKAPVMTNYPYLENGGAVVVTGQSHPTFRNCRLEASLAYWGGGAYVGPQCGIHLVGCTVEADSSVEFYSGSGLTGDTGSTVTIRNSVISENRFGYGAYLRGTATLDSCTIRDNRYVGIGLWPSGRMSDCTISGNGMGGVEGGSLVQRCLIAGNEEFGVLSSGTIEDCTITANQGTGASGGGVIRDCVISDNDGRGVDFGDGGEIHNCFIAGNRYGGVKLGFALLDSCTVMGNGSPNLGVGGGVFVFFEFPFLAGTPGHPLNTDDRARTLSGESSVASMAYYGISTIRDCVVTGNTAAHGGGIAFSWDQIMPNYGQLIGSTVSGNRATTGGGLALQYDYQLRVEASVLWGNCADDSGDDVHTQNDSTSVTFLCSAVDSSGFAGPGRFVYDGPQVFTDPLFCSPASCYGTPTTAGDYRLASGSPCLPESSPCDSLIGALGLGCSTTGLPDDKAPLPLTASLRAYPNPFRADVTFVVGVPDGATGSIEIFDVRGRRVRAFEARAGESALRWDGRTEQGVSLPQGIYFVRLRAGAEFRTQRVILIR